MKPALIRLQEVLSVWKEIDMVTWSKTYTSQQHSPQPLHPDPRLTNWPRGGDGQFQGTLILFQKFQGIHDSRISVNFLFLCGSGAWWSYCRFYYAITHPVVFNGKCWKKEEVHLIQLFPKTHPSLKAGSTEDFILFIFCLVWLITQKTLQFIR